MAPDPALRSRKLELRVLVAEDNPVNQALLREQLEELGCHVSLASDGGRRCNCSTTSASTCCSATSTCRT
ncbi:response regulator [Pseudomonas aeruginosa]|uniref:response regulator n=1 Tax=Pseudomonas aeruginosa TaxID=287 RepID=UPI0021125C33|nr:hypothetical protein [Pseudomonas aeruginosa]MCT9627677.1 hypothetical protein [Pseudomonas aeruginosa]